MKIYQHQVIKEIRKFYGDDLLQNANKHVLVKDYLLSLAHRMYEGVQERRPFIFQEMNNYHKDYLGRPIDELEKLNLNLEDCKKAIANEYGFESWELIEENIGLTYDDDFETVVNFLLNAQFDELKKMLKTQPSLISRKSKFGHQATLLHYVASNGVEFWRQIVPMNLAEMTQYLMNQGAYKEAKMKIYGGEFSTLALLESSAHPFAAGIGEEMKEILK